MTTTATRRRRVASRLCIDCEAGLQDGDGTRCVECAERARVASTTYRATDKGREANRNLLRLRYQRRRALLSCVECGAPAPVGVRCEPHRAQHAANKEARLMRMEQT